MAVTVGRRGELRSLTERWSAARAGRGQVVVIRGEAGIGKTTLLRELTDVLDGDVVRVSGDEVETTLPYGVADQLLRLLRPAEVREPLGSDTTRIPDPTAVGADLLDTIGTHPSPLAVVIDDAHWADLPSLQALAFTLRRLPMDPVLTILVGRPDLSRRLPESLRRLVDSAGGCEIELQGLAVDEVRQLAGSAGVELTAGAASRLAEHTRGNPLYVVALAREIGAERLNLGALGVALPAPKAFAEVIADRVAGCGPTARRLIEAAATLGGSALLSDAAVVADLGQPVAVEAADHAHRAGLLEIEDGARGWVIRFAHPLIRAAVYQGLSATRASALHQAAAAAATDERERLRHRVSAASADNETLCRDLEAYSRSEAKRGAFESGAWMCLAASGVAATPSERERLVLSAMAFLLRSNDPSGAADLLTEVEGLSDSPLKAYLEAVSGLLSGRPAEAIPRLEHAWTTVDFASDPALALAISTRLATVRVAQSRNAEAIDCLRRVATMEPVAGLEDPGSELVLACVLAGGIDFGLEFVAARPDLFRPSRDGSPRGTSGLLLLRSIGPAADPSGAHTEGLRMVEHYRRRGPYGEYIACLDRVANAELNLGLWDNAIESSEMLRSAAAGLQTMPDIGSIYVALIQCRRGDTAGAEAALATIDTTSPAIMMGAATVRAEIAALAGDHSAAADVLAPMATLAPAAPVLCEPSYVPWRQQFTVDLIAARRVDEARAQVEWLRRRAVDRPYPTVISAAARVTALLASVDGDVAEAEQQFDTAVDAARRSGNTFVLAQVLLDQGTFARRVGGRGDALAPVEAAHDLFAELRANPWLERCEEAISIVGRGARRRRTTTPGGLTPAEQAVARMVAGGANNREVAARLVVSVRTVESHLGNIYMKLGIRSRSQLIHALADAGPVTRPVD